MGQQPLAVLTEGAVLKAQLIQIHIRKPTNEEVGVQPLRWDREAARDAVYLGEDRPAL